MARYSKGNETRENILSAACDLFLEKGYFDVTYQEICSAASVNPGTFAYHFGSKRALARILYSGCFLSLMQKVISRFKDKSALETSLITTAIYMRAFYDFADLRRFCGEFSREVLASDTAEDYTSNDDSISYLLCKKRLGDELAGEAVAIGQAIDAAVQIFLMERTGVLPYDVAVPFYLNWAYNHLDEDDTLSAKVGEACGLAQSLGVSLHKLTIDFS